MALQNNDPGNIPGDAFVAGATAFPNGMGVTAKQGTGCYVTSESGDRYLDYVMGAGTLIAGHANPRIQRALTDQVERGTAFYVPDETSHRLADRITDIVPCADQVKLGSTGSQATYFALRLARAFTEKESVLKFAGGYHGWHDSVLVSSIHADDSALSGLMADDAYPDRTIDSAGAVSSAAAKTLTAPFNDLDRTRDIVDAHSDELAAIIVEPLMRSLPPVDGFLEGLRGLCDDHDILLIFDEVVTGFRMALGGAQEFYGVEPDLATYAKALGGGVPISAVCGREEVMRLSDPSVPTAQGGAYISGTLCGNPLCAAASHATLDILEKTGTHRRLNRYGRKFRKLIDDVFDDSPFPGQAIGDGPIVDYLISDADAITGWDDILRGDTEAKRLIDRRMFEQGILQLHGGKRFISTEHGDEALDITAEAFKTAVGDLSE